MIPDKVYAQIAGNACPQGMWCYNPSKNSYFSSKFPLYYQDPSIPIHLKEFMCIIIAIKKWGSLWAGCQIQFFCDNDSVVDVITYLKPKNELMQSYLREFLYLVCKYNFCPIASKISTRENDIADFLSRNFIIADANAFFSRLSLPIPDKIDILPEDYIFVADWWFLGQFLQSPCLCSQNPGSLLSSRH